MDYYEILEIDKNASLKDIKSSYKRLAIKYHPDKNKNDINCCEKFKQISEAYQVLSNETKRRNYDNGIKIDTIKFDNPTELFKNFFKDIPWEYIDLANSFLLQFLESPECDLTLKIIENMPQKDKIIKVLEFILIDITDEYTKEVIQKYLDRLKDNNTNSKNKDDNYLNKSNNFIDNINNIFNLSLSIKQNDSRDNKEYISTDVLNNSNYDIEFNINLKLEDIYNKVEKTIEIKRISYQNELDKITDNDNLYYYETKKLKFKSHYRPILTFKQEGNQLPNKIERGDIILNIEHKSHPHFNIINDYDLIINKKISIYEAYYGTKFTIPYFNNRNLSITTDINIYQNHRQKIKGLGLPIPQSDKYGDLYIVFEIEYNQLNNDTHTQQFLFYLFPPIHDNQEDNENTEQYLLTI